MGAKAEQQALAAALRADGASWARVVAEFRERWGRNARQTLRVARGWTQQQVADEWCRRWPEDLRTAQNVSTWERWPERGHCPSLVVLDRLAQIYRCSVVDLVSDFPDHGFDSGTGATGDHDGMDRRTLLAGSLASVTLAPLTQQRPVDPETVNYLRAQLGGHWRTDRELGPHVLLPGAVGQCEAVLHMVDTTRGRTHTGVLNLAVAFTGFVAWLYQDAGDLAASVSWLDRTLELAHRAGDPQLLAYALTSKAMIHADTEDGVGAIELAEAALTTAGQASAKARVMAMQQAALGHALVGHRAAVDGLLDQIGQHLEEVHAEAHTWGGDRLLTTPSHIVDRCRATCYGHLGLAEEAADLWGRLTPEHTAGHRDRGVYLARHAVALLDVGEPREAARQAAQGASLLARTGSARMRREFGRLHERAVPWTGTRAGRELAHVLDTIAN